MSSSKIYNFFLVLVGIVLGTFVGYICKDVNALSWLAYGVDFGLETPFILNLGILRLTFGFSIDLTLSVVIFVVLSLVIGRALAK